MGTRNKRQAWHVAKEPERIARIEGLKVANRPAILKQSDLARYAKALRDANIVDYRIIARPDGSHEIVVGKAAHADDGVAEIDAMLGLRK